MNILLIGGGGREHALAWKLAQSPLCDSLYAAPGNPGIAEEAECVDVNPDDHSAVINFCAAFGIGLVVIGPEAPLVGGLADSLREAGITVFGPSAKAAQLEGSKSFTKEICAYAPVPSAMYEHYLTKAEALEGLSDFTAPYVIKADGLASGKGVIIAETLAQAEAAIEDMLSGNFGAAGASLIIEDFMEGEEVSFFALTDGKDIVAFGSAQDHKRVGEGDTGPNTGGMGAYSPARVLTPALEARVMAEIIEPTVAFMAMKGLPYSGVLFAGVMLTADGPKLIEYNCRFGDPECQVLMMRYEGDLVVLMLAVARGRLAEAERPRFSDAAALTVVIAANGYPGSVQKGGLIRGVPPETRSTKTFHAGTAEVGGDLVANGGRVLAVTASGTTVSKARDHAYALVDQIDFAGGFARRDIGWREIERERDALP
ncbi:MAG: phosphoribosylamine--glycine ligase [Sphingomonadaceae bacterium]